MPITGRSQLQLVSGEQEVQMGAEAYKEILAKAKISADPAANALVTRVGTRIAAATGRSELPWEFKVIDDPQTVNAFALPGGKVAVYTGILPITRDEAGLAVVLGHEVSHVMARHSAERISEQLGAELVAKGIGAAIGLDPQITQAGAGLLVNTLLLPWGRKQESEADHLGLIYMAKAGYHPNAARDLWKRMAERSGGGGQSESSLAAFLSTHPLPATRITQIEGWIPEALKYYKPR